MWSAHMTLMKLLLDAAHTLHVPVVETLHGLPTPIGNRTRRDGAYSEPPHHQLRSSE